MSAIVLLLIVQLRYSFVLAVPQSGHLFALTLSIKSK